MCRGGSGWLCRLVVQNMQFQCNIHEKPSFFEISLRPFCRTERKGQVCFAGLQQSRCMLPAVESAPWKHQGMFDCFGWHLTQERIMNKDFIERPLKSTKKSTFTFWTIDKLQLHFICTQLTSLPPVQGYGLPNSHAECVLKKLHP